MVLEPALLLLDEPTSQLDPIAAGDFLEMVQRINRELGTTILLAEHRLAEAVPRSDRLLVLEGGQLLCQGTPREVGGVAAPAEPPSGRRPACPPWRFGPGSLSQGPAR